MLRKNLALYLWDQFGEAIPSAIVATQIYRCLRKDLNYADTEGRNKHEENVRYCIQEQKNSYCHFKTLITLITNLGDNGVFK